MGASVSDPGRTRSDREAFPSCEICGAVVRRQLMRLHHAWHDDVAYSATRRPNKRRSRRGTRTLQTPTAPPEQ